jgi:hypothetical protein
MYKQALAFTIASLMFIGCAATEKQQTPPSITNAEIKQTIESSQQALVQSFNEQCGQQANEISQLTLEINQLKTEMNTGIAKHHQIPPVVIANTPKPVAVPAQCSEAKIGEKFLLGEVESVYVDELKVKFATRIDTGAVSSSLNAQNIVEFERDGEKWVRFDVLVNGPDQPGNTFEFKLQKRVRIKQDAESESDRRPVIHAHLKIGKYEAETDLNLTDRSHLDYPLLLGRKFMKDIAIVDVGQIYIHGKAKDQITNKNK